VKLVFYVLLVLAVLSGWRHYQQMNEVADVADDSAYAEFFRSPDVKVVLYGTEWCGYCAQARDYLNERGVAFTDLDIETSERAKREHAALGGQGVPLILVGDHKLKGYNAQSLKAAVDSLE